MYLLKRMAESILDRKKHVEKSGSQGSAVEGAKERARLQPEAGGQV